MNLDAILRPRGPLPAAVYWRRRLVTLAVLAVLLLVALRAAGGGGSPTAAPEPSPSRTTSPSPSPSAAPSATAAPSPTPTPTPGRTPGGPCGTADLLVEAVANATEYAPGVRPVFTLRVTNAGPVACTRDLGQGARELRVRSGNDRIWSSDDCAPGGGAQVVTLRPGEVKTFSVTWSRTRSAPGCPAGRDQALPGTYQVIGRLGDVTVTGSAFRLR